MKARLPDLLHDLAGEMPVDVEPSSHRVVRRARTHRAATAFAAGASVLALVIGAVFVLQIASAPTPHDRIGAPTGGASPVPTAVPHGPSGTTFAGLWPESTAQALADAQAQVDAGHTPLRLDAEQTAAMLATNLFGWQPDDVVTETTRVGTERFVDLRNRTFTPDVPPITVGLAQLGRTGPDGIWSVVKVSSPMFDTARTWVTLKNETDLAIQSNPSALPDGAALQIDVLNGVATATGVSAPSCCPFDATLSIAGIDLDSAVLWIRAIGANGAALGATAGALSSVTDAATANTAETPMPATVAATRDAIQQAAAAHDATALDALIDPSTFAYDFGDAGHFTQAVRDDPSLFDTIAQVLALPLWVNDTEGSNVTYVWPGFMEPGALDHLTDAERAQLHGLGFSDGKIEQMARSGGYLGPRLGIAEDGTWVYFVTGGD